MSELWQDLDLEYDYDDPYGDGESITIALDEDGEPIVLEDEELTGYHIIDEDEA